MHTYIQGKTKQNKQKPHIYKINKPNFFYLKRGKGERKGRGERGIKRKEEGRKGFIPALAKDDQEKTTVQGFATGMKDWAHLQIQ